MKFFKDGLEVPYDGGRTEKTIIDWVKKYSEMEFKNEEKAYEITLSELSKR